MARYGILQGAQRHGRLNTVLKEFTNLVSHWGYYDFLCKKGTKVERRKIEG
jgi:hypothetical protein